MTFLLHRVSPPLSSYVNFLYAAQGVMPFANDCVFPTPSTDLKFNFGDPWRVSDRAEMSGTATCIESWCLGIWDRRHFVEWPKYTDFIGVSFKPGGAYGFLDLPLSELRNCVVPLDALWGDAAEIRDRLHEAKTPERRFALMEDVLLARIAEKSGAAHIVEHVAGQIASGHGARRIGELCDEVGVTRQHLISLFDRMVGCPPKQLARLCRFGHTLESIDPGGPVRWTSVAQEGDYFDQAHFGRDFQALAGLSPSAYLQKRRAAFAEDPDHASVPWVLAAG